MTRPTASSAKSYTSRLFGDALSRIILAERIKDHMPQGIDIRRHLSPQAALPRLAFGDRLAKGDALFGPLQGRLERAFGSTERGHSNKDPADFRRSQQLRRA